MTLFKYGEYAIIEKVHNHDFVLRQILEETFGPSLNAVLHLTHQFEANDFDLRCRGHSTNV